MVFLDQEKDAAIEPLLETGNDDCRIFSLQEPGRRTQDHHTLRKKRDKSPYTTKWLLYTLALAYIPLVILYILLYFKTAAPGGCSSSQLDIFPSLARSHAVRFSRRKFAVKLHNNPFAGPPRPELDAAWHNLFEDIRIQVSREDLEYYNLTSVPLADGSGYAAELGVHHELHCLKKIRHWIHRDYYLVNETEAELVEWSAHIDHCVEMMRESIICRGDPSLSTFEYLPGNPPRLTAVALGHHQCVNWDSLLAWVRKRAVPIFEPDVLERPEVAT